ncbi:biopolymer transporter ExbD [Sideroxydans sp. CL21]|jgi:biopolymer transport protein ExbD|uniref:ExbD/TolR family protein n=1 Tax=Sideroxydans sp. CL21 TaxID=2600596 RepID=UPI0012A83CEA|nr:biopolymer transporter ExbD [Sideroxydans sp. CL21]VVC82553.1 Biopolymer transport protein ExbD/TolR [Sideroxydans sp. CL21]
MLAWNEDETPKKARIEIIPMIDVMMFLLVFFVLISLNVIPALGIKTTLPGSAQPDKLQVRKHAVVTIAPQGQVQLDGTDYSLAGLSSALKQLKASGDVDVVINSDKDVSVQQLVDVMDSIKSSGITAIAISSKKK